MQERLGTRGGSYKIKMVCNILESMMIDCISFFTMLGGYIILRMIEFLLTEKIKKWRETEPEHSD